ncbi:transcriptional regulator with XRE-family HTH domain [Streptomonospora salina]|uniref:Transcriptional regulator with XRE-family HTH domain n=3 Tax=Streptomonospora salina TaxID=104205 RepID=A0A841EAN7_9ACTN|nr:helix-turn-helix transcriptional regulator [Streptomonospora salina]MBB5996531.1 transcriptional regulator with XRE-family HTH domain [Streptomonospora salina]MBB6000326.1 transcriptional regulator with XRE-family HTH domain [Streptomonospora salina]
MPPGRALDPIDIPAWAWSREDTRRLLQERDIAGLLRLAQRYGGASQTRLAAATGIAQGRVSEILNGRKQITALDVIERIADGLNMPDSARMLFGLAPLDLTILTQHRSATAAAAPLVPPPSVEPDGQQEESVKRREFVGLTGAALFEAATGPAIGLEDIASALTRYAGAATGQPTHPPDLASLTKAVHAAKAGYQACHYGEVARRLPALLNRLDAATRQFDGDSLLTAHSLRAEAYHVAASVLLKSDERGLAWLAADRSMQAAENSENPATLGASARIVTRALMTDRHYGAATELATTMAERVDTTAEEPTADSVSVYGALLLSGAVAAAKRENRGQARALLDEAEEAGRRLGGDHNYQWTAFGPTNVLLHRVNTAVEMGDAGSAIDHARRIRLDNIDVTERKVTLFVDAARAYSQWGKLDRAFEALVTAENLASEELSARPSVHTLINDIGTRATGHLRGNITDLAERVGLTR